MKKTFLFFFVLLASQAWALSPRIEAYMIDAKLGEPWAQLNLGAAYDNGIGGLQEDPQQAVAWYRKAAEQGVAEAQFNLAHCLATGRGTVQNYVESFAWMQKAAQQQIVEAQFLLGVMYKDGLGSMPNPVRAKEWLERAAKAGNEDARALLQTF